MVTSKRDEENKLKKRRYMKSYNQRKEVKEKRKQYNKEYYARTRGKNVQKLSPEKRYKNYWNAFAAARRFGDPTPKKLQDLVAFQEMRIKYMKLMIQRFEAYMNQKYDTAPNILIKEIPSKVLKNDLSLARGFTPTMAKVDAFEYFTHMKQYPGDLAELSKLYQRKIIEFERKLKKS